MTAVTEATAVTAKVTATTEKVMMQTTTATWAAAMAAARNGGYDLVLMDMQMPRLDGLGATRAIRALPGPAGRVRIVALTANSFAHDREACLDAGMDGYMAKPITLERLDTVLAEATAPSAATAA